MYKTYTLSQPFFEIAQQILPPRFKMSTPVPYLDPLNQAFADQLAKQPPLQDLTVEQTRQLLDDLQKHTPNPNVTRTSFTVPFENGVKTFVFRPKGVKGILPVIFFFHGVGWEIGK